MVPEAFDLGGGFGFDGFEEIGPARVVTAAEHEVVPYHNAKFVADVVEGIFFPNPSAPNPKRKLVVLPLPRV